MRNTISLFLLLSALSTFAQRVSFEDPDLTFSFKKPKNWQVFDDGYVVKVSPSAADSATIYFTITYFENAQPFGLFSNARPADSPKVLDFETIKIAGKEAKVRKWVEGKAYLHAYTFRKYGQHFQLKTATLDPQNQRIFRRIIKSIKVEN